MHEKVRIPISLDDIQNILDNSINDVEEKLTMEIIKAAFEIKDIPELHDRLIAGTARYLDVPLITNDPIILKSKQIKCIE
ncbi:MAG: hypothetical protein IEMM0008_0804 [bacterium]|nr:MAG: hypothetical protein IEMM0008_0804 [bacterium]